MKDAFTVLMTLISFIMMCVLWRQWKNCMRETLRDRLFKLRDEWRSYYVDNGRDMTDGAYARLRDILNFQLRYTREIRFIGFVYIMVKSDPAWCDSLSSESKRIFDACDEETRKIVSDIRRRAAEASLAYMAATSLGFISGTVAMFVCLLPARIVDWLKFFFRRTVHVQSNPFECAAYWQTSMAS